MIVIFYPGSNFLINFPLCCYKVTVGMNLKMSNNYTTDLSLVMIANDPNIHSVYQPFNSSLNVTTLIMSSWHRNWCEHHVCVSRRLHSKNRWWHVEPPRGAANPTERGKMWSLAHASVTKSERGFHNLMVFKTQWAEPVAPVAPVAPVDQTLNCSESKVSFWCHMLWFFYKDTSWINNKSAVLLIHVVIERHSWRSLWFNMNQTALLPLLLA